MGAHPADADLVLARQPHRVYAADRLRPVGSVCHLSERRRLAAQPLGQIKREYRFGTPFC